MGQNIMKTKNNPSFATLKGDVIEYSVKRLYESTDNTIIFVPHVCNNMGSFGAGFAKHIGEKFPIVKENFLMLTKIDCKLGKVQFVKALENAKHKQKLVIANMISQNGFISRSNPRPINYASLVYCMTEIKHVCDKLISEDVNVEIHCPKFGSGLAGGNWNFITNLIEDIWNTMPVYIYNYNSSYNKG
jgi:hypothetical protein